MNLFGKNLSSHLLLAASCSIDAQNFKWLQVITGNKTDSISDDAIYFKKQKFTAEKRIFIVSNGQLY